MEEIRRELFALGQEIREDIRVLGERLARIETKLELAEVSRRHRFAVLGAVAALTAGAVEAILHLLWRQ